jgi:hypothetical protein
VLGEEALSRGSPVSIVQVSRPGLGGQELLESRRSRVGVCGAPLMGGCQDLLDTDTAVREEVNWMRKRHWLVFAVTLIAAVFNGKSSIW